MVRGRPGTLAGRHRGARRGGQAPRLKGLKTNLIRFDRDKPYMYGPGPGNPPGFPELDVDHRIVHAVVAQLEAFRRGAGRDVGLHLDTNFNYKIDGYIKLARALEPLDMVWLEIDLYDPAGLNLIRRSARTPIASLESIYGRRNFRPYFEHQSVDYAIIDVAWNGILESLKIAAMADAYEVNIAPHNFNGHLGSLISAHMCAVAPNFKVMEIDIDDVTWKDDIVAVPRSSKTAICYCRRAPVGAPTQRRIRTRPPSVAVTTKSGIIGPSDAGEAIPDLTARCCAALAGCGKNHFPERVVGLREVVLAQVVENGSLKQVTASIFMGFRLARQTLGRVRL
jgi:hypothetical protein